MNWFQRTKHWWIELDEIAGVATIARRYFVMSGFDGILTMVGLTVGSFLARIDSPRLIIATGLSTAIAMGVSGLWGAFISERSERKHDLLEMESAMLVSLNKTRINQIRRQAIIVLSLVNGLAPFVSALICLTPFMFAGWLGGIKTAYYLSFALITLVIFCFGIFLGKISDEHLVFSGLKMLMAGVACVAILWMVEIV